MSRGNASVAATGNRITDRVTAGGTMVALCGGIGGAKLAYGLSRALPPGRLRVIVNVGDDFRHLGLHVSPDIDTVVYTLSERSNPRTGWGRDHESWRFMEAVEELGGETWFSLGDTDLATSAVRTARLQSDESLSKITDDIARALNVPASIIPVSDQPVATVVDTLEGELTFQRYFVGRNCEPVVRGLRFDGAGEASPSPAALAALTDERLAAVVICPSNPYLSIDPMLAVPGFEAALRSAAVPIIAVAPLVGGQAIKGPLTKLMAELGHSVDLQTVADHYRGLIDILLIDEQDAGAAIDGPHVHVAQTVMRDRDDRIALARAILDLPADPFVPVIGIVG